ncbi:DUF1178 family protein [Paracoccus alkenifer]|uniref:DUF1178 family protein n=1 Tax=Paracoccus alkenifer TaxID=65735 RepID=A0A1H6NQ68_9RHOB|nr:DUF1178 family protein [Paracoccus alkenifer]SEI13018.1 hypothetical protein SAMN04488075_0044 [Paracoccus alkenifer]
MIRYTLRCDKGHDFDSWFRSAAAYDALSGAGQVSCAVCGSVSVQKAPMAPAVPAREDAGAAPPGKGDEPGRPLARPASAAEAALQALRRHVEENSSYVGRDFASTARAMHAGDIPERSIHGEARPDEARKLIEEGVPVAPLPFRLTRKLS